MSISSQTIKASVADACSKERSTANLFRPLIRRGVIDYLDSDRATSSVNPSHVRHPNIFWNECTTLEEPISFPSQFN